MTNTTPSAKPETTYQEIIGWLTTGAKSVGELFDDILADIEGAAPTVQAVASTAATVLSATDNSKDAAVAQNVANVAGIVAAAKTETPAS